MSFLRTRFTSFLSIVNISYRLVMRMHFNQNCFEWTLSLLLPCKMAISLPQVKEFSFGPTLLKKTTLNIEYIMRIKWFFSVCSNAQKKMDIDGNARTHQFNNKWPGFATWSIHVRSTCSMRETEIRHDRLHETKNWFLHWIRTQEKYFIMYSMAFCVALLAFANRLRCYFCA